MSVRDELATIITSHTVSWDQASLIADSILDLGWGSPDDVQRANEYGFDEGVEYALSKLEDYRKIQKDLRGPSLTDEDVYHARQGINGSGRITYGRFESAVLEALLSVVVGELDVEDNNPYRPKKT